MAQEPKATGTPQKPTTELGVSYDRFSQGFRWDEFIPDLRGRRAIRKYREMRDNDPVIGALMTAIDMMLRAVDFRVEPVDDSAEAEGAREYVESVLDDMEHGFDEFLSEAVSFLAYGFATFEVVYKRRGGMLTDNPERRSKFDDGLFGIRKLASRAQWTVEEFVQDDRGNVLGIRQEALYNGARVVLPLNKLIYLRTAAADNAPVGRSILRNAYLPYYYASHVTTIESIAIERELNGLPVARIPTEYLAADATATHKQLREKIKQIARDVKFNDQGYIVLPSDLIENPDGTKTSHRMVDLELLTSSGTRNIDTGGVIKRHQQDMARSVMADFLMLGQSEKGSFALSKSKTDLFLRSLEGYANYLASALNKQLLEPLWQINGMDYAIMPSIVPGDVAPPDLEELGNFVNRLAGSGVMLTDEDTQNVLRASAGLPENADEIDDDILGRPDTDATEAVEPDAEPVEE